MHNEEEILNQALMAYSLGYPWIIHQDILMNLSTDFFNNLYKAMDELHITISKTIDPKNVFARFSKAIQTTVICSNGYVAEHNHSTLVANYHYTMDSYRRGVRP